MPVPCSLGTGRSRRRTGPPGTLHRTPRTRPRAQRGRRTRAARGRNAQPPLHGRDVRVRDASRAAADPRDPDEHRVRRIRWDVRGACRGRRALQGRRGRPRDGHDPGAGRGDRGRSARPRDGARPPRAGREGARARGHRRQGDRDRGRGVHRRPRRDARRQRLLPYTVPPRTRRRRRASRRSGATGRRRAGPRRPLSRRSRRARNLWNRRRTATPRLPAQCRRRTLSVITIWDN